MLGLYISIVAKSTVGKLPVYAIFVNFIEFALKCHDAETLAACFFGIRYLALVLD